MAVEIPRKTVLAGAGVGLAAVAVAACSSGPEQKPSASEESSDSAASSPSSGSSVPGEAEALAATADVPVGSGVIVDEIVVTQPVAGEFKGFSSVCTHSGCQLNAVEDGTINCPCHGSKFSLDGAVVKGPATRPLETVAVRVQGDSIVKG